jgi:hypothetical protein
MTPLWTQLEWFVVLLGLALLLVVGVVGVLVVVAHLRLWQWRRTNQRFMAKVRNDEEKRNRFSY